MNWIYNFIGECVEQVGMLGLAIILLTLWAVVSVLFEKRMLHNMRKRAKGGIHPNRKMPNKPMPTAGK